MLPKRDFEIENTREDEALSSVNSLKDQQHKSHQEYESRKTLLLKRRKENTEELSKLNIRTQNYKPINIEDINKNIELLGSKLSETDIKIQEFGKQWHH